MDLILAAGNKLIEEYIYNAQAAAEFNTLHDKEKQGHRWVIDQPCAFS